MRKKVLVAPLNWGLGHATRCIPIIQALLAHGFEPVLASDGAALTLLQKEFPKLLAIELPSYGIQYAKKASHFKLKLLKNIPKILKAIRAENKAIKHIVKDHDIIGVISDNRLGVRCKKVPSVYITHQLNVLSGSTTWFSTKLHQNIIKKFDACWVPDVKDEPSLSGKLGHTYNFIIPTTYIGPLSRFKPSSSKKTNPILVLLSGPEPQRTLLETKLFSAFKNYPQQVVFVKGTMEKKQTIETLGNLIIYNYMTSVLLEQTINNSALVISRSGYTSIMDLAKLNKKAFFIPTPGQYEQEYLAKRLQDLNLAYSCHQDDFDLHKLEKANAFKALPPFNFEQDFKSLFRLF
ncbi:glycosyltransferase [Mariniflexile ostreae]|uniref:Glycosyltransferase n=1 Tax=Mariniflexile ostreae TaxID=1520892 RepID=A0ABV5FB08_9FLAO